MEGNIKMDLREVDGGTRSGSMWLRIGAGGGLLRMGRWNFGFDKMQGIF
jgi:hypothetical protein